MNTAVSPNWDASVAKSYSSFCARHSLYEDTSTALVEFALLQRERAGSEAIRSVLDLGCGTGITTACVREMISPDEINAIDISEPMLELARSRPGLEHVVFHHGSGNNLSALGIGTVDLIVANASLWLMNMPKVLYASAEILSTRGLLCFNIPAYMLHDAGLDSSLSEAPILMRELDRHLDSLRLANGYAQRGEYRMSEKRLINLANTAGLSIRGKSKFVQMESEDGSFSSLSVPVILDAHRGEVDTASARKILRGLYQELRQEASSPVTWINYAFGVEE